MPLFLELKVTKGLILHSDNLGGGGKSHISLYQMLVLITYPDPSYTALNYKFKELKVLEREPLRYCKDCQRIIFLRPFLTLGKVTFVTQVNVLERSCKGDISATKS